MKPANDIPARIYEILDIDYIAYNLNIDSSVLLAFCISHENDLLEQIQSASLEVVEWYAYMEGLINLSDDDTEHTDKILTAIENQSLVVK